MNKKIKELNQKLIDSQTNALDIESELQLAWNDVFKDTTRHITAVAELEESKNFAWDKYGEIVSWIRFDLSPYQDCKQYFSEFMREYNFVEVDWDNDCLTYRQGPSIVINDDGDVYDQDSGKFFLNNEDCLDEDGNIDEIKRNGLIEEYMEKNGCFPNVFISDNHNNVFLVNTKE